MITLSLLDPTIYGTTSQGVIEPVDDATVGAAFLSGEHLLVPQIQDPTEAALGIEFLQGAHFDALTTTDQTDDAAQGAAFLSGRYFFALDNLVFQDLGSASCAFQVGSHSLTLIIDPQFANPQKDRGNLGVEFLQGVHAEIITYADVDPLAGTIGCAFLQGAYTEVTPGTGLLEDQFIVRFSSPDNSNALTVSYVSDNSGMPEAHFTQPFTDHDQTSHQVFSYIGGVIEPFPTFVGGAVDNLYALIFTRITPDDTVLPPGQFRGGATGDDADRVAVGVDFFAGHHFLTLLFDAEGELASNSAEFLQGVHQEIIAHRTYPEAQGITAGAAFQEGEHQEIRREIEVPDDTESTIGAEFFNGIHEIPFGDNPTADSSTLKVDNTGFTTDNGGATFDDSTEAPTLDSILYSWDHEL